MEKIYLVRVQGHPVEDAFSCDAPIGIDPTEVGGRVVDEVSGLPALTRFNVLARNADGTATLEAVPLTGRTNQIRIHLWHLGHTVCGDPLYLQGVGLGTKQTLLPEDLPMCLHAWKLSFRHPSHNEVVAFEAEAPYWSHGAK